MPFTVVVGDDVQTVEQLSLVLVDPLDLKVEHGVGVDLHLVGLLKVGSKLHLVLLNVEVPKRNEILQKTGRSRENVHLYTSIISSHLFDFGNIPNEGVIVHKVQKVLQLVKVTDVVLTNPLKETITTWGQLAQVDLQYKC